VLSTVGRDGNPHAAPVMVWFEGDDLRFETEPDSVKFKNLTRHPVVSICVFGSPKWAVVVRGAAEVLPPGTPGGGMADQAQILVRPERKVSWRRKEG
jgi:nitroimidazol reductase NimA-like FMN-containing flavoprotein (pyridoxamine 5'-phosphate oxidase superfamily)